MIRKIRKILAYIIFKIFLLIIIFDKAIEKAREIKEWTRKIKEQQ